ncbi:MAG: sigma-54-dependent Fis family transcriptional regulator [Gemmatimonadetes bacterium]|nr:sigma-54-dependent Fis family transcriptional regulator [Gemmatimonadota bacterium]MBT5142311.1 sigma-54-dependent Fis family transcriptional regulator [Gemmatimonadota bacterium]MBT5589104.1 sigma-54-dependent Fis family transcriptional regulator [Gemmatimonadota bacterium]MBT5960194.1 sigma-54-dependent Fis family transcriptional regulator [Gemmatimonadota bacterium]MBT6626899.1 sigma-54-dependent Fis family transcriptional regulator [Gemmatimonadota bacterium]
MSHTGWRVILLTMVTHTANEPADPLLSSPAARCIDGQTGMGRTLDGIRRVLGRPVDVLLQGESGTGKELAARILHEADPVRCAGQFVAVNCAALPEGVLEAELFGVCRGAFTGADVDRRGLFRLADGGTLFLDEVGDLPTSLQPKLLRALQERRIRPLGGVEETSIDVRVISATHVDLNAACGDGRFRADLYFRLADYIIDLPPLRHRRQDIPALADIFLSKYCDQLQRPHLLGFTAAARSWLRQQDWRANNVRELDVVVKRAVLQCDVPEIDVEDLRLAIGAPQMANPHAQERDHLEETLRRCNGNIAAAARELGVKRSTLFDRLRRHQITSQQGRRS